MAGNKPTPHQPRPSQFVEERHPIRLLRHQCDAAFAIARRHEQTDEAIPALGVCLFDLYAKPDPSGAILVDAFRQVEQRRSVAVARNQSAKIAAATMKVVCTKRRPSQILLFKSRSIAEKNDYKISKL